MQQISLCFRPELARGLGSALGSACRSQVGWKAGHPLPQLTPLVLFSAPPPFGPPKKQPLATPLITSWRLERCMQLPVQLSAQFVCQRLVERPWNGFALPTTQTLHTATASIHMFTYTHSDAHTLLAIHYSTCLVLLQTSLITG